MGKKDGTNWSNLFSSIKNSEHTIINFILSSSKLRKDPNEFAIRKKESITIQITNMILRIFLVILSSLN